MHYFRDWIRRILPNSQAIALALLLFFGVLLILTLGEMLMPVLAGSVIAYLLEGIVAFGERNKLPRSVSVVIVFSTFMAFLGLILFALLPLLYQQTAQLFQQLPSMVNRGQQEILRLPELYPEYVSEMQIREVMSVIRQEMIDYGQQLLSVSANSFVSLITITVYLILVPLLVFFFLKDKHTIIHWVAQYLPRERHLSQAVWGEVDIQIGNYIRGKFVEVFILGSISFVTFSILKLNYALLLSVCMGLSVIIPYVGATLVTFPVIAVAYFQWGFGEEFTYTMIAYAIIQTLDGVVLVPLLFSEAVNLHPVAIIVAILFFGGVWDFWGVFFAIPLATLVKAVLTAWPRVDKDNFEKKLLSPPNIAFSSSSHSSDNSASTTLQ